jgi:hypothetical protein
MVLRMSTATIAPPSHDSSETRRKSLLAESDGLLEDVESLRLRDRTEAPSQLRDAIRSLQLRLGRRNPPVPPATLHAAHDLVFAVQQRLMAANPNLPGPNRHTRRPSGQPLVTVVRDDHVWKVLTLPPAPNGSEELGADLVDWLDLIDCTVERAWDRWCYAQQHAVRAARENFKAHVAVAVARAAWTNYWDLLEESGRIRERLRGRRGAGRSAAPRT